MTITEFLTARYDEDEAAGCGCETNEVGDIRCHQCGERVNVKCWKCSTPRGSGQCPTPRSARVLADIAAKRAIVQAWIHADADAGPYPGADAGIEMGLYQVLHLLAQPYAEHPDFDLAWRVE